MMTNESRPADAPADVPSLAALFDRLVDVAAPDTTAAAVRRREIDEIVERGPRAVVEIALDALDLAISADAGVESERVQRERALAALARRTERLDRRVAALEHAVREIREASAATLSACDALLALVHDAEGRA
ncbi:hypothetical protein ACFVQ3_00540 [Oerskovia sp. NPDC057915]|uniref:hypothetical protein n=1 Tax=Oerskovia sp. NPDC057915 TaxID=3346280 RepID=UPI0036D92A26